MAESQKEAGSASKAQKKNSLLDDEIGNDFFTSWKTMSANGDDALNFNEEAAPKGKKSAFNFDKLDMDFSLDGGFGKNLSSFKVDMTDLDFLSPPKKPAKPKEQSAKESNLGKKDKQDRFSFNFDFDELDKFDLGESLMKKDKKLDKSPDDNASNSPRKQEKNQGPRRNLATSIDAPEHGLSFTSRLNKFDTESCLMKNEKKSDKISDDKVSDSPGKQENNQGPRRDIDAPKDEDANKLHKSERVASSNVDLLTRNLGNFKSTNIDSPSASTDLNFKSTNIDSPSASIDSGSFNASQDTRTLQEKEIISSGKGTDECSEQSTKTVYTELNAQEAAQDSSNRSVSVDDSSQDATELQTEFCSSATEVDTNPDGKPNFSVKLIGGLDSNLVKSCNIESLPANCQPKSMDNEFDKKLESHTDVPMGDLNMNKSIQGDTKVEDASVAIAEKLLSTKSAKENKLIPKLLPTALHSEPKSQKLLPLKVKGTDVHSKPPNQSGEIENPLKTAVIPKKTYSVIHKFEAPRLSAPDARRQEANLSDAQAGNQKLNSSVSQNKAITKGLPAVLGSEKDNINQNCSSSFQTHSATSIEQRTEPKTMNALNSRLLVSSIPSIRNSKCNSFEGNKLSPLEAAKKTFDVTSLKLSKPVTPKVDLLHTKGQTEMKSLKRSDGNAVKHISPAAKMHRTKGIDQQGLVSPSMKRKMFEVPKAYPVTPHLLTRVTGSSSGNREDRETFERVDNKRVRNNESHLCSFSPTIDIPWNASPLIENDGIVEKAEAYAKELESICNMLKKKNEEVKEILVRAVVNNNNLLMLNHPIYDEKIRNVQRFASQVLSREIHN